MAKIFRVHFPYHTGLIRHSERIWGSRDPVLNPEVRRYLTRQFGVETKGHWPKASKHFTWHFNWYRRYGCRNFTSYTRDGFEIWVTDPLVAIELRLRWS
jgi:hypothetical protein